MNFADHIHDYTLFVGCRLSYGSRTAFHRREFESVLERWATLTRKMFWSPWEAFFVPQQQHLVRGGSCNDANLHRWLAWTSKISLLSSSSMHHAADLGREEGDYFRTAWASYRENTPVSLSPCLADDLLRTTEKEENTDVEELGPMLCGVLTQALSATIATELVAFVQAMVRIPSL